MRALKARLMAERAALSGRKLSSRTNMSQSEIQVKSMKYERPETAPLSSSRRSATSTKARAAEKKKKKQRPVTEEPQIGIELKHGEKFAKLPVSDKLQKDLATALATEPQQFVHLISALSMPPASKVCTSGELK